MTVGDRVLVLIGPSGSGKSSLASVLARAGVVEAVQTVTTRPPRCDESVNADHVFVTDAEFDRLSKQGAFVAEGSQPGLPYRYGLPVIGEVALPLVILRAASVASVAAACGRVPLVYQVTASQRTVRARLAARGCGDAELDARRRLHAGEVRAGVPVRDRLFVNDSTLDRLVDRVVTALREDLAGEAAA